MDTHGVSFVGGLIIGVFAGFLITYFVVSHNDGYNEAQIRKQMVELGVGHYDTRTGGFQTKACRVP